MALDFNMTRLLLNEWSKTRNDFGKTASIGRQGLHVSAKRLQQNLNEFGLSHIRASEIIKDGDGYFEPLFKQLGASLTDSIDLSEYEGASVKLDLNKPLPISFKNKYDTLIDSGSLEHIFNFPTAIKNCLELVALNGKFILIAPCNNFFGHGFYQFSPELFFRIFSHENGFRIETMTFFEDEYVAKWYTVKDPEEVKQRVELINYNPSYLFIVACKKEVKQIFEDYPNQSDYQNISWKKKMPTPYQAIKEIEEKNKLTGYIPYFIKKMIMKTIAFYRTLVLLIRGGKRNSKFFKRIR